LSQDGYRLDAEVLEARNVPSLLSDPQDQDLILIRLNLEATDEGDLNK
jgi:protein involved in temperature-dependent protein secretion